MLANAVGVTHSLGYDDANHDGKLGHPCGPNPETGKRQSSEFGSAIFDLCKSFIWAWYLEMCPSSNSFHINNLQLEICG